MSTFSTADLFVAMKRDLGRLAFVTCLIVNVSFAQARPWRDDSYRNLMLINPGELFTGSLALEYERALGPFFGLVGGLSVALFDGPLNLGNPWATIVGPEIGFKFHFIQNAPVGLWLGPYINAGYVVSRGNSELQRLWAWGAGAGIGYNFQFGRFVFQIGASGGFTDHGYRLAWAPRLKLGVGGVF